MMIRSTLVAICIAFAAGCASPPTDGTASTSTSLNQQAITATTTSYNALDAAISAANAAAKAGQLKGGDARNALQAFTRAKEGLDVALVALRSANAAAAAAAASGAKP